MDDLLARAMQGVDPDDPGAFLRIFLNLMALVPWGQLIFWQVVFVVVGGVLGWWRGRFMAGVVASLVLGPFGWVVPFLPRRVRPSHTASPARALPPRLPLPPGQPMPTAPPPMPPVPPPLPGSKNR